MTALPNVCGLCGAPCAVDGQLCSACGAAWRNDCGANKEETGRKQAGAAALRTVRIVAEPLGVAIVAAVRILEAGCVDSVRSALGIYRVSRAKRARG